MTNYASSTTATQSMVSALFKSLYMQMAAALTVTGLTAYLLAGSASFWNMLATNPSMVWILFIAQIGLVIWLSARVMKMSMASATMLFIAYSVLTGVTLSSIFLVYSLGTIATTFFVTAGTFFVMSLVGYTTRMDLSRVGNVLYMRHLSSPEKWISAKRRFSFAAMVSKTKDSALPHADFSPRVEPDSSRQMMKSPRPLAVRSLRRYCLSPLRWYFWRKRGVEAGCASMANSEVNTLDRSLPSSRLYFSPRP